MDERAQLLVRLLDEKHGMQIDEDTARYDVSGHVDYVAQQMGIGRQAAKFYVTDEVIEKMAGRIAKAVDKHQTKQALDPKSRPDHLRVVRPWDTE